MSLESLIDKQNPDGGWPHRRGVSWTEPTCYAVLALLSTGETAASGRGIRWLNEHRRSDGGWPACIGVDESCWATALAALIPPEALGGDVHRDAIRWLLGTTGEESTRIYRIRQFLLGNAIPADQSAPGWPWVPGAAAWVGPTSLALLALDRERERSGSPAVHERLREGRTFLLNRMCRGGGWNHGSTNALGYPADPYPETTGMALAALRGHASPRVDLSIAAARRFLDQCRSADAWNWLRMGLSAHGGLPDGYRPAGEIQFRTVPEIALDLAIAAGPSRNPFFKT
jgi:hypothetical protein